MPFTAKARRRMLMATFVNGTMYALSVGADAATDEREPITFEAGGDGVVNATEVIMPRLQEVERNLTHWFIFDEAGDLMASDKLERPILLRRGERATFPPGALRLGLT